MSTRPIFGETFGKLPLLLATFVLAALAAEINGAGIKTEASSVHSGEYQPQYAFDGDRATRWASRPIGNTPQWLQIDMGKTVSVGDIMIRWENAFAREYKIQVSPDGKSWKTIHEQKAGKGGNEIVRNLAGKGRYFRLLCTKANQFSIASIWEIEFLGSGAAESLERAKRETAKAREVATQQARSRLASTLAEHGVKEIVFAMRQPGKDGHWYANFSHYADDDNRLTYGAGGKLCRMNLATGEVTTLLEDKQGGVRDPVIDFDAKKILFSYRKESSLYFHLYEMSIDGENMRQLTDGPFDDIEPSYLPDGKIVFVSSRCNRWVQCWLTKVAVLHRCNGDGTNIQPISANLEHDNTPWPLPDGRIMYQRWEYIDRSQVDYHHLWTTNPDGTRQMVLFGNMHPGTLMIDAKPIVNTEKIVAIFSPGHGAREHNGYVTVVDPQTGPDDPGSATKITRTADYRDPWAFSENAFLAARGKRLVLLNGDGVEQEIYRATSEELAAGLECHEPRPIIRRSRGRVISDVTDSEAETGKVVLVDVYKGRNMEGVKRGEIKKLLVLESLPKPINFTGGMDPLTYGGSFTLERVLGTVPVEPDGSAFVELPASRALFFVSLDKDGLAVKRMRSFLSVQPGEVFSCAGCHEKRTETALPTRNIMALNRAASKVEPIDGCPDVFDFPRDIQPILNNLCVDCHGHEKTDLGGPYAGKILLTGDHGPMFSHAYFTMTVKSLFSDNRNQAKSNDAPRSLGSAASRILKMLDGSHYGVEASEHQKTMLRTWIDLGAPYPGPYAALGCGSIGGYIQNRLVNTDFDWPETKAAAKVIDSRCASCHKGNNVLPKSLSDERGISFWRFSLNDPRLKMSRHIVFNLSEPEKSLMLLAPLSKKSGGFGLCQDESGAAADVFVDKEDPDYQALLSQVEAGRQNLQKIKRFDMPGFQPRSEYLREMTRYGVLPEDRDSSKPVDGYELDRRYWESLWYRPKEKQVETVAE